MQIYINPISLQITQTTVHRSIWTIIKNLVWSILPIQVSTLECFRHCYFSILERRHMRWLPEASTVRFSLRGDLIARLLLQKEVKDL